jgi:hypothetical protein
MDTKTRNRLAIGSVLVVAGAIVAYNMYFSLTPPRHADHDHAIAKLDAGGFLWIEAADGERRNLVGKPGKVLVLHWFDAEAPDLSEQTEAARFAASNAEDPSMELLIIAQASSWDIARSAARTAGVPDDLFYLDLDAKTGDLCGVRRTPETLVFDPDGFLAHQARGPVRWTGGAIMSQIERAKAGVEEIH